MQVRRSILQGHFVFLSFCHPKGFFHDFIFSYYHYGSIMTQTYPVILSPAPGATPIPPSTANSKSKAHGQSELVAFARFFKYGCGEIREDVCVRIAGHNYEPDFAYIDEEHGVFIDIEVDEPYSASGHPTHFLLPDGTNKDSARNERFRQAGWYVIRFSEEQIFCHTAECLREVYKLARAAGAPSPVPRTGEQKGGTLHPHPRWTKNDSYDMKQRHHRKTYLGYDPTHMDFQGFLRCTRLILPVAWQSIFHARVRREMFRQLFRFFSK